MLLVMVLVYLQRNMFFSLSLPKFLSFSRVFPADIKSIYEKVTAPKIPSPPHTPAPRRTQADIEREKRQRLEEKEHRLALKQKSVPPYFESELGRAFLISNSAGMFTAIKIVECGK